MCICECNFILPNFTAESDAVPTFKVSVKGDSNGRVFLGWKQKVVEAGGFLQMLPVVDRNCSAALDLTLLSVLESTDSGAPAGKSGPGQPPAM